MKFIDRLLDSITIYRLILYYLIFLLFIAVIFSFVGILDMNPFLLIFSTSFLLVVCLISNKLFSRTFNAPVNVESVYISALILALLIYPAKSFSGYILLFFAALLTMASKYIIAIRKKHIFNPVAIAVVLTALGFNGSASWWIGTEVMLPFSLLGILIVRKLRKPEMILYFFISSLMTIFLFTWLRGGSIFTALQQTIFSSPVFFFAFVMFTEPLTTPPTRKLQAAYGIITGILFAPQFHLGTFFTTPELALILGNIFSYLVSPKYKIISPVRQKLQIAPDVIDFIFDKPPKLKFTPGQYMELTVPHKNPDTRGNRRYFTIASSPTEDTLRLGIKFYPNGSSYKKALAVIDNRTPIVAAQLSGDFTLPKDPSQKLVFIAGGIGITPFRSMIKYLIDTHEPRPVILFYANKTADEIIYIDILNQAQKELGIKTIFTLTDPAKAPSSWQGKIGRIDTGMIAREAPDFKSSLFYLSGPHAMVTSFRETLATMNITGNQIKIDFFPGFT